MSYEWNFPQTKRLMNSLHTLSFFALVMGFCLPPPYWGFLHSSHWPSHWCCHNLLTTKFSFYFNLVHVVLDELRTWHKKKVPTSNLIECTLLTPRIYLKSEVIRTIVSLGKTIFLKFTNFPFYSCLYKHHSHSMPHNFVCNQDMFHNSTMLFPTLPDFSKATTHTPTKQHKLTKHHTSHNSLSFIAAFITFNSPSFAKLISFCLQPFSSLKPKSRCDWHAKWNPFLHLFKPHVLLLQVYCLWAFWFPLSFPALLKNYRRTHFPQIG